MGHRHVFYECPFEADGVICSTWECQCGDMGVNSFAASLAGATAKEMKTDQKKLCGFHDPKNNLWYLGEQGINEWVENRKVKQ